MVSKCGDCKYWLPIDGSTLEKCVCLFCYLNGRSRRRWDGTCLEYEKRRKNEKRKRRTKNAKNTL